MHLHRLACHTVLFTSLGAVLRAAPANASGATRRTRSAARAFCALDLSDTPISQGSRRLFGPANLGEGAIRPGLLHVQDDLCRCVPWRRRHQPSVVRAELHIAPNRGHVTVAYRVEQPWSPPVARMVACLGAPMLVVDPLPYRSDMVTEDGPLDEVLVFPIVVELTTGPQP